MSAALDILTVCTHNRTRSVMMSALLESHLRAAGVHVHVHSAGTTAAGQPAMERAVRLLAARGLHVDRHRSRPIDAAVVKAADLIITAEQHHVVAIAGQWPEAFACTFTLPELVVRAESVGRRNGRPLREWLGEVGEGRTAAFDYLEATDIPEVADPTGRSPAVWDESFARIDALTRRLAQVLA